MDEVIICPAPAACFHCGGELAHHEISQRKQVAYLKDKRLVIKEFQCIKASCVECRRVCRGALPPGTPKGAFGSCVLSIIAMLTGRYRLSKRQVKACLYDLFNLELSVGTLSNAEKQVSASLAEVRLQVYEALKQREINHVDETTHFRKHRLSWLWLLADEQFAYLSIHCYRNGEMARCLLDKSGKQTWVTDRYQAYNFLPKRQHQYCWSHLKRDIKAIIDHPHEQHATIGRRFDEMRGAIFKEYREWVDNSPEGSVLRNVKGHLVEFRRILREGAMLSGQKTPSFCRHLIKNWRRLWNFLMDPTIPATNNHAERMLRHNVLWRKLSLGTQSERGDRYVERISTVQLSCRLQGRNLLGFLGEALNCFWLGRDPPSLLVKD